jgi:uncharacterized protein YrrD
VTKAPTTRTGGELIGLPIVSLQDAEVVGEIDALIIDDATLTVAGFLVDLGFYEAKVMPMAATRAIGHDAVIVERTKDVGLISQHPDLARLADRDMAVTGAAAVTAGGRTLGTIGELTVDVLTGRITAVELLADPGALWPGRPMLLPAASVLSVDHHQVVLDERCGAYVHDPSSPHPADAGAAVGESPSVQPRHSPPASPSKTPSHYLLGRRVVRRIEGPLGVLVADAGEIVTEETIRRAESSEALLILSLNVE